jgi:regulator of RNase E activity RraA
MSNLLPSQRAALARIATPHLSDALERLSGVVGLTRYNRRGKLVGTAFTVKTRPGDNLFLYRALDRIAPGEALVVDGGGDITNALAGELLQRLAASRGCAGFVLDGAVRDVAHFEAGDFPCYARGVSHRGPYKSGPGRLNVPVSVGGQAVLPGDVVVGDEDGVVVFGPERTPDVLREAEAKAEAECAIRAEIATGDQEQRWLTWLRAPESST